MGFNNIVKVDGRVAEHLEFHTRTPTRNNAVGDKYPIVLCEISSGPG